MPDRPSDNLLSRETSPYLLQHADNPVHWRAWGPEALREARQTGKPILLSVGYAACHWCHVMAHESFANPAIARVMNALFVNIKVDREERPDIDQIYQTALALLGQQGGWPLTMFLTPDGEPFWGGTYFPAEPRYGRPGFTAVLERVAQIYRDDKALVDQNRAALVDRLAALSAAATGGAMDPAWPDQAARGLMDQVDMDLGGTREAPKFPQPFLFEMFWRAHLRTGQPAFAAAVTVTLDHLCQGGIYDHLGGGFARYSTDERWLAPHFEKMLYDNAQLVDLLTLVWQETRSPLYARRIAETMDWLAREMITQGGGFAATLDADSEGEEGRFYVWSKPEIEALLGADAELFCRVYDVHDGGNWEGRTILNRLRSRAELGEAAEAALARARATLLAERDTRVRPGWDDKVLADWNGLMIAAAANAAMAFGRDDWLALARTAFAFVCDAMTSPDGRLLHSYRDGQARHTAMLDDYACMIRAAIALNEATGDTAFLDRARRWVGVVDAHYWDTAGGGYFQTADDAEALIVRTRSVHDSAVPAANGLMIDALARLHYLIGEPAYADRAQAIVDAFAGEMRRNVFPLATYLNGYETLTAAVQVTIVGDRERADTKRLIEAAVTTSLPTRVLQVVADPAALPDGHPAASKTAPEGAAAFVCTGPSCSLPVSDPSALADELARRRASGSTIEQAAG